MASTDPENERDNRPEDRNADWNPCPKGEISGLAESMRQRTVRRERIRIALLTAAVLLVTVTSVSLWRRSDGEARFGGITCQEVEAAMPEFLAGTLPPDVTAKIERHIEDCPACGAKVRALRERQNNPPGAGDLRESDVPVSQFGPRHRLGTDRVRFLVAHSVSDL